MWKVLLFLAFLVSYLVWSQVSYKSMTKLQKDVLAGKSFWSSEMILLEGLIGFFGLAYLLSGLWSPKLVLLIFVASHLAGLLAWVLTSLLGNESEEVGARSLWAGYEVAIHHPLAALAAVAVSFLVFLALPVVAGIAFFRYPWGSATLQVLAVRYVLLLTLAGFLTTVPIMAAMLATKNLDEETRQRIFINQLSALIPSSIYVALAIWAFGLSGAPLKLDFLGIPDQALSLQTLAVLLIFFALAVLIPYLVGTHSAGNLNVKLLKKAKDYIVAIAGILETPAAHLYAAKLTALRDKVTAERDQLIGGDPVLAFDQRASANQDNLSDDEKRYAGAIAKARGFDARFRYLDDLNQLETQLGEIVADLQARTDATIQSAAEQWSKGFESRRAELDAQIAATSAKKPLITAGAGSLVTILVSGIMGEVAKTAWQWIVHVPK